MAIKENQGSAVHTQRADTQLPHSVDAVQATASAVFLPDGHIVVDGAFHQRGDDLLIVGADGDAVVVKDYFLFDPPPAIETGDGGWFTPQLVQSFLIPETAGQYAQASFEDSDHQRQELLGASQLAVCRLPATGHEPNFPVIEIFFDNGGIIAVKASQHTSVIGVGEVEFAVMPEVN